MKKKSPSEEDRFRSLAPPGYLLDQVQSKLLTKYNPQKKAFTLDELIKYLGAKAQSLKSQEKEDFLGTREKILQEVHNYYASQNYLYGLKLKKEFLKRNTRFQELKIQFENLVEAFIKEMDNKTRLNKNVTEVRPNEEGQTIYKKIHEIGLEILPNAIGDFTRFVGQSIYKKHMTILAVNASFISQKVKETMVADNELEDLIISSTLSPIEIAYIDENKIEGYRALDPREISVFEDAHEHFSKTLGGWKSERQYEPVPNDSPYCIALDAVDLEEKTISLKIKLNRQKEDIINYLDFLLDLLKFEADLLDYDLGKPKKPQWDIYEKYLQVYDLKKDNPEMSWSDIALKVFPEETIKSSAYKRKPKKELLPHPSAVDKVEYYWEEANKMINQGGWKQI